MQTNKRYWQTLPSRELIKLHNIFEQLRKPVEQSLPRGVISLQGLLSRKKERNGIELIVYNECKSRNLI